MMCRDFEVGLCAILHNASLSEFVSLIKRCVVARAVVHLAQSLGRPKGRVIGAGGRRRDPGPGVGLREPNGR